MERFGEAAVYLAMGIMLIMTGFLAVKGTAAFVMSGDTQEKKQCIVIDAGHGGDDPGKVGINGALEKDINLQIAQKLKILLEMEGLEVIMTRTDGE